MSNRNKMKLSPKLKDVPKDIMDGLKPIAFDIETRSLLGGPAVATNADPKNWPQNQQLTLKTLQDVIQKFQAAFPSIPNPVRWTVPPGLADAWRRQFLNNWLDERKRWSKEEMAKQVELYRNIIETKFGVKLCVKNNHDSAMTSMELLVPNELFADDKGRESLADALQNIAMFIMSMDTPSD